MSTPTLDLPAVLRKHEEWLESQRDNPRRGECAMLRDQNLEGQDLAGAKLAGADLSGANLARADLSGADLGNSMLSGARLRGATLTGADLRTAHLGGADLRAAILTEADLSRAKLGGANLRGARLERAFLTSAELAKADLRRAQLSHANLYEADLTGANLERSDLRVTQLNHARCADANLTRAKLGDADCTATDFDRADLEGAAIAKAVFNRAHFTGANLRDVEGIRQADFHDANLEGAAGLLGTEFAGTDVTGATLPKDIHEFSMLKIVEESSRNARTIFFSMLLASAYSWLTIATTTDARLLTNSSSSPLPIIGTEIPIAWFYRAAPAVLVGVFVYLHFYLQRLWTGMGGLPARFPDGKRLDERAYPWLLTGLARRHVALLRQERPRVAQLEELVAISLAWGVVPLTLLGFWMRFLPRHEVFGTSLHVVLIGVTLLAALSFHALAVQALHGPDHEPESRGRHVAKLAVAGLGVVALAALSWSAIRPASEGCESASEALFALVGYRVHAELSGEELRQLRGANLDHADASGARLGRADLRDASLRCADLSGADLTGADLRGADLRHACGDAHTFLPTGFERLPDC